MIGWFFIFANIWCIIAAVTLNDLTWATVANAALAAGLFVHECYKRDGVE